MRVIHESDEVLVVGRTNAGDILFGLIFIILSFTTLFRYFLLIVGIPFLLAGIYLLVRSRSWRMTLSKQEKTVTHRITGYHFTKQRLIPFDTIREIAYEQFFFEITPDTGPRDPQDNNLLIILNTGETILINTGASSPTYILGIQLRTSPFSLRDKNFVIARKIAGFIGVPFVDRRPSNILEGFAERTKRLSKT